MTAEKCLYFFSKDKTEGSKSDKSLLGGKGANLAEMSSLGIPVPPGFTLTTSLCMEFQKTGRLTEDAKDIIKKGMEEIGQTVGKTFGDKANPLLVSVRSGAPVSMPGMMDTVLNLGLNEATVLGVAEKADNLRFAYDSYIHSNVFKCCYGHESLSFRSLHGRSKR